MRDKIAKIISEGQRYDCSSGQLADDVYFLIAPELEKARRFDGLNHADSIDAFVETFPEIQEWKEKARKWDRVEGALKELKKGVDCVSDALTEKEAT